MILSKNPKPSFIISRSNFSLVWFGATNQFLLVQDDLDIFFSEALVQTDYEYQEAIKELVAIRPEILVLFEAISTDNTNSFSEDYLPADYSSLSKQDFYVSYLFLGQNKASFYYNSKALQTLFLAPFTHLKTNKSKSSKEFIITKNDNKLKLFAGKKHIYSISMDQFFVLQAQFVNQLTEFYHSITSPNWLCSFHGCAVQKKNKSYLLLGNSGTGKSTLSSLLSFSDYRFIADDLVLMDHDFKIYDNPAAVSVKENAWPVIERFYKEFKTLKTSKKIKGQTKIKFLPLHTLQNNSPETFEIEALIWVHYSKNQINRLSSLDKKQALSRLIPDTWIFPKMVSAKAFANWAMGVKTYCLDYSDFNTAKKLLDAEL
tara:strand:- start:4351 stop:5469 length:1119 start_codon:yes stop_codon:yes gene_type:complete